MSFPVTNKGQIERHVGAKICSYDPFSIDMLSETEFFQRQASIGNGTNQRQLMKCDAEWHPFHGGRTANTDSEIITPSRRFSVHFFM